MGGLLVLLAVAVTSVTYGWQPDGTGGVEYLVQVSPDKLAQVRSTGEISSTIPAEIRGHVSRVVIRVGDGPLPRTISSAMQQSAQADRLSAADRQNVPIPQIGSHPTGQSERVMKPQNEFSFPDAASRAGDRVAAGVNDATARLRSGAADRMSPGASSLHSAGTDAMRRAADRTSATARDDKWFQLNGDKRNIPNTDPVRAPSTGNFREPPFVGPTRPGDVRSGAASGQFTQAELDQIRRNKLTGSNARLANTRTATDETGRNQNDRGFGSNGFGMMPAGMSTSRTAAEEEERRRTTAARDSRSGIGFADARLRLDDTRDANSRASEPFANQRTAEQRLADQRLADSRQTSSLNRNANDRRYSDNPRYADDPRFADDARRSVFPERDVLSSNRADPIDATNIAADRLRARDVDSRLSKTDVDRLPAGAWSFDEYDNPIDKQKRVLDRHGIPVSAQRAYELTLGRKTPAVTHPHIATVPGIPNSSGMMMPNFGQTTLASGPPNTQPRQPWPNQNNTNGGVNLPGRAQFPDAIDSASDRRDAGLSERDAEKNRQSLAAQPLFNFLLLMSIVANVYLVFWLKNLRHQFHDLVSSKRVATSDAVGI